MAITKYWSTKWGPAIGDVNTELNCGIIGIPFFFFFFFFVLSDH